MPGTATLPSIAEIERLRDRTLRRLPALRVQGPGRALRFINEVGLASLFATHGLNLPCLWVAVCGRREAVLPLHTHYDPEVGLAWDLKDRLPTAGKVFYAKLIRGKPTFVAWDVFPDLYRLLAADADYLTQYRLGHLSPTAKAILDALHRKRPQDTFELKLATNHTRAHQRPRFDRAMAEVQQRLYVAMREVRYNPFTYVWDLVEARYPQPVVAARRRLPRQAARRLLQRYLEGVIYASRGQMLSVLGSRPLLECALADLRRDGVAAVDVRLDGLAGRWTVLSVERREHVAARRR